jgi:RNA polymerase sigma-70 factor (ECF subfamily)
VKEFEILYDKYFRDVYRFILSLSKNPAVAEDVVQDTFIKALKDIKNLRDDTKVKSWLFQIAKNTYLTHVSKSIKTISIGEVEIVSPKDEDVDFLNKDTAKQIRKLLHGMKEPYKEIFYLRVFAGVPYKEIAEIFEKEEAWARQIFHRSRIIIKEKI